MIKLSHILKKLLIETTSAELLDLSTRKSPINYSISLKRVDYKRKIFEYLIGGYTVQLQFPTYRSFLWENEHLPKKERHKKAGGQLGSKDKEPEGRGVLKITALSILQYCRINNVPDFALLF